MHPAKAQGDQRCAVSIRSTKGRGPSSAPGRQMPVQPRNLDQVVILVELRAAHTSEPDAEQVDHCSRDVHAMEDL